MIRGVKRRESYCDQGKSKRPIPLVFLNYREREVQMTGKFDVTKIESVIRGLSRQSDRVLFFPNSDLQWSRVLAENFRAHGQSGCHG